MTVLFQGWVPPPHGWLQLAEGLQADSTQSTGQGWVLHGLTSALLVSHWLPPCWAGVSTVRIQVWVPPPQLTLHSPLALQADSTQSTGLSGWLYHYRYYDNIFKNIL